MRARYRMYETNSARLGRLVIHYVFGVTILIIISKVFLEVV